MTAWKNENAAQWVELSVLKKQMTAMKNEMARLKDNSKCQVFTGISAIWRNWYLLQQKYL